MRPFIILMCLFLPFFQSIQADEQRSANFEFKLRGVDGRVRTHQDWAKSKFVVVYFMGTECPVSKLYIPEMNRIAKKYSKHDVSFCGIISDPEASPKQVRAFAKEYRITFPLLLDPKQILARHTKAKRVPECAVLNNRGKLLYGGRIDDWYLLNGRRRREARKHDLREALDAVLAGKAPRVERTKAFGCPLPVIAD